MNTADHEEVRQWLLKTIRLVVDQTEEVAIDVIPGNQSTTFLIRASVNDRGKVIGRQGRTSQSLRVLTGAMGKKFQWRFIVEIDEDKESA